MIIRDSVKGVTNKVVRNSVNQLTNIVPIQLGAKLWIDPTQTNSLTLSGSNVSKAKNLIGNSDYDLIQNNASLQMELDPVGINGKAAFFNDRTKYMTADVLSELITGQDKPFCMFFVFDKDNNSVQQIPWSFSGTSGNNQLLMNNQQSGVSTVFRRANSAFGINASNVATSLSTPYIHCHNSTGITIDTYLNDRSPVLNDPQDVNASTFNQFTYGGLTRNSPGFFFGGHLGEMVYFDRYLSANERLAIMQYLGDKYGIDYV